MKKILLTAILAIAGISAFAYDPSPKVKASLGIRSYTRTDYTVTSKFGEYFRTPSAKYIHVFDEQKEIENTELTPENKVINKISYLYNTKDQIVSQTGFDDTQKIQWKVTYTYKNGALTEESEFDGTGTLTSKTIYKYEGKNPVDETLYNSTGSLIWKNICTYTETGLLESVRSYYDSGDLESCKTFKYDESQRLTTIMYYDDEENFVKRELYRYSDENGLTEITTYDSDNTINLRVFFKYDTNGMLSKVSTYRISYKFGKTQNELIAMSDFTYKYKSDIEE